MEFVLAYKQMMPFHYRAIIDTWDTADIKADWIPLSNGSESSALLICVYKWRSHHFGMEFTDPIACSLPGPSIAMQTPQESLGLSELLQLLLLVGKMKIQDKRQESEVTVHQCSHAEYVEGVHASKASRTQVFLRRIRLPRVQSCCLVTQDTGYLRN